MTCPECKREVGGLLPDATDAHELCWDCREVKRRQSLKLERIKEILGPKGFLEFTFESFIVTQENRMVHNRCLQFDPKKDNIYLWGPTGVGKTHLAYAMARRGLEKGLRVKVYKMPELLRLFWDTRGTDQNALIEELSEVDMLVIDEIGLDKTSENTNKVFYEIIDGRIMNLKNGLIFTGNLSLEDFAVKTGDSRIPDRMAGICEFLKLEDESWRTRKRRNGSQ